jgi:hypothetical protein
VLALVAMWIRRGDPVGSFSFAILAMLAATPVLWSFYFAAALLPLALRRPRFSLIWLVPLLASLIDGRWYSLVFLALVCYCALSGAEPPTAACRQVPVSTQAIRDQM